jgi:phosphoglycolate phosphatase/beta-phosphoglucomutase
MIKSIFFDFNGVIIDDETIQMNAYKEVLKQHDIDLTEEWYFSALGMDDRTFIKAMFERAKKQMSDAVVESVLGAKIILHREMIEDELPLFPGVLTFLKTCSRHFSLGLVSMADSVEIGYVFERAHLNPLFTVMVMAGDVSVCKPAPDCYRRGLEKLNEHRQRERLLRLLPNECVAIEDSPQGIEAARGAGMHTIGITNTVSEEALRAAGADVVTKSIADWTPEAVKLVF